MDNGKLGHEDDGRRATEGTWEGPVFANRELGDKGKQMTETHMKGK